MSRRRFLSQFSILSLVALSGFSLVGCGSSEGGYRVSGKVTFKGSPVPSGKIYFMPDGSKGASGSTGFADIRNGTYDTSAAGGRNAPSGAVVIAVEGIDNTAAPDPATPDVTTKVLFARHEVPADLPKQASTKDIDVPESAAKGPVAPPPVTTITP